MSDGREQTELLRRYVLGELSEDARQQIEEHYFGEPELLLELNAVRAELLDEWARNTLPSEQREQLERQMEKLPVLRRQGEFALSLRDWIRKPSVVVPQPTPASSFFTRWISFLTSAQAVPVAVAAGLLVCLGIWLVRQNRQPAETAPTVTASAKVTPVADSPTPSPAQMQPAPSVTPLSHAPAETRTLATFFLTPSLTRDGAQAPEIKLPKTAQIARLQLEIESAAATRYTATLQAEQGERLWEKSGLAVSRIQGTSFVSINLPVGLLKPQMYVLRLSPSDSSQNSATYNFSVTD